MGIVDAGLAATIARAHGAAMSAWQWPELVVRASTRVSSILPRGEGPIAGRAGVKPRLMRGFPTVQHYTRRRVTSQPLFEADYLELKT